MIILECKIVENDKYMEGYFLTPYDLAKLVRNFQVDCHDGFVSNDISYIQEWLKKHNHIVKDDYPEALKDWYRLIELQKENKNKDMWSVIPQIPGYKFKNLKIEPGEVSTETGEMTVTLKCDEWKK